MRPIYIVAVQKALDDTIHIIRRINTDLSLPKITEVHRTSLLKRKKRLLREAVRLAYMCGRDVKSLIV